MEYILNFSPLDRHGEFEALSKLPNDELCCRSFPLLFALETDNMLGLFPPPMVLLLTLLKLLLFTVKFLSGFLVHFRQFGWWYCWQSQNVEPYLFFLKLLWLVCFRLTTTMSVWLLLLVPYAAPLWRKLLDLSVNCLLDDTWNKKNKYAIN